MRKVGKIVFITVASILLLSLCFFSIDLLRVQKDKTPLFCIPYKQMNNGETNLSLGLGYKVIDFHSPNGYQEKKIANLFMQYEDFEKKDKGKKEISENPLENIKMEIKEQTLTNSGATVIITDENSPAYVYGNYFRIEKKQNDQWNILPPITKEYAFTEEGILVGKEGKLELEIKWEPLYGKLAKGEYRIVKQVSQNQSIFVEFTL